MKLLRLAAADDPSEQAGHSNSQHTPHMKKIILVLFAFVALFFSGTLGLSAAGTTFKITKTEYDAAAKQVLLIWSSDSNRTYTVEASLDLKNWQQAGDGVASGGIVTAYKVLRLLSDNQSYFRIREYLGSGTTDPVMTLGHGTFVGSDGKEFRPTTDFILQAQQIYISNLMSRVDGSQEKQLVIQNLVTNNILANALFLDWLLEKSKPDDLAHLTAVNNGLRWHYVIHIQSDPILPDQGHVWSKGVPIEIARQLETNGVSVFLITNARGEAYRQECRECGVPVPPPMFGPGWRFLGIFDREFLSEGTQAELWIHESPEGVCLALPRYIVNGGTVTDDVDVLGIICLGVQSSKICFFDNPASTTFTRNVPVDISQFVGGLDLVANNQGVAGRFPDVSTQLPGYCRVVLATATGTSPKQTMPLGGDRNQYINHINALLASCDAPPTGGGVVVDANYPDDQGYISAPIVIDPVYQCATKVSIRGAILDATVNLYTNGIIAGIKSPARNPSQIDFDVLPLIVGDIVTATQELNGVLSESSPPVIARDHRVDFPAGLPAPAIDPSLIYECANVVAVRHVPGAIVTLYTNGVPAVSFTGGTGWSAVSPGPRPFAVGDEFTAEASLCADVSPRSPPGVLAVSAPPSIPPPTLNPPTTYNGQELVTVENLINGSLTTIREVSFGSIGEFSTPISWHPNFDVATPLGRRLTASDRLIAFEKLCDRQIEVEFQPVAGCEALPAPRIRHPIVGNNYVVVDVSVPGARIHVYDDTGVELGDGSGTVIMLRRALTGTDILMVVQQLGQCTSSTGYRVNVRNASAGN